MFHAKTKKKWNRKQNRNILFLCLQVIESYHRLLYPTNTTSFFVSRIRFKCVQVKSIYSKTCVIFPFRKAIFSDFLFVELKVLAYKNTKKRRRYQLAKTSETTLLK